MIDLQTKRIYDAATPEDGLRILVDRVWPRGMTKAQAQAHLWLKEVAPSTALRKWFGHDRSRWQAFMERYFAELEAHPEPVDMLLREAGKGRITLLYAARDRERNQAVALRLFLLAKSSGHGQTG